MNIQQVIDDILDVEGGYVNLGADHGGPTKYGVTLQTLREFRGVPVSVADLRALTRAEARDIYIERYYERPGLNALPEALQPFMLDFAVHSGPPRAVRHLQGVVGAAVDGVVGPETVDRSGRYVDTRGEVGAVVDLVEDRLQMLAGVVVEDPSQAVFMKGWVARVLRFLP